MRGIYNALIALVELSELQGESYKAKAYAKAAKSISQLKRLPADLRSIPGVGESIEAKITEYQTTGKIAEIDKLNNSPLIKTIRLLMLIPGVGPVTAREFYKLGIRKPDDLRRRKLQLTHMQSVGLQYLDDITQRIPRDTVTEISYVVSQLLRAIDAKLTIETLGSYRRQLTTSGDVDMLCTGRIYDATLLPTFYDKIQSHPRYVATFSHGDQRVSLLFRDIDNIARQVDLFHAKWEEYIPYLMYATGSGPHNEMVRGVAKAKGYRLNQSGLFKITTSGLQRIVVNSERDVYNLLGLEYTPPNRR